LATPSGMADNRNRPCAASPMKLNLFPIVAGAALALAAVSCKKSSDAPQADGSAAGGANSPAAAGNPDDPAVLKLRWPVGGRFGHRMEVAQTTQIPAMPGIPGSRPATQEMNMGQEYSLNVLRERPGGGREVELEFQSVNLSVSMGGNEVLGFDTRGEATGDESNPAVKPFRQMVGQKLKLLFDASNTVERVEGMKEFQQKVFGNPDGSSNPMASMFNEDSIKQLVSQGRDLPAQPVKPGATWPSKFEVTMGPLGKVMLDLTYTFKGWEQREQRRCAALTYTGSIGPNTGDPNSPFGAMMSVSGGQCSGKAWFDPARGMIIDNLFDQTIQMRMKLPGQPGVGAGAAPPVETSLKQNVSIKLVEESRK
ncbi:MAG TPA: DUF6263 family protein, partial [Verrucomicrobiae bacterium]|nr:DUF6263 family protein [Verrucomicrobiae bacterium]